MSQPSRSTTPDNGIVWEPTPDRRARTTIGRYLAWLDLAHGRTFSGYDELWQWSVTDLQGFWGSIWDFFGIRADRGYDRVLTNSGMPGAHWFSGAELNYAARALARRDDHPAIIAESETRRPVTLSYADLCRQTAAVAAALKAAGVRTGDRVVAYLPNTPETVIAFLACASLGATWASCPPEFGVKSVVERFRQIEPRVLFAVDGYRFKGKAVDRRNEVAELRASLPSLEQVVLVPCLDPSLELPGMTPWRTLLGGSPELAFAPVPFEHPLWVLYSSGTTGLPKAIVQGHGGILLEHLKCTGLHLDITAADRFFWYTTTGWMMWNYLLSGLLVGATVLLYDGHPAHPDLDTLWDFAERNQMTYFGTSAPYLHACLKAGLTPSARHDLSRLKGLGSTAAPLTPEGFRWVYDAVNPDLLLNSFSGGTDLCTGIVGACPLVPVRVGEIPCRMLGAAVEAFDSTGRPVRDEVGELVITQPMPSMPLYFWNDPGGRRYRESYFETYPGVWRHGDWITITTRGSCVIWGRSDSTLNRGGVRIGTSELYRAMQDVREIADCLVIDTGTLHGDGKLWMFVVLANGVALDDALRARIAARLRQDVSPRHVPDEIRAVPDVPYTLNGKKLEVPIKRILTGTPIEQAVSLDAVANPAALRFFVELAATLTGPMPAEAAGETRRH